MDELSGQTAIVTGAARGIGLAIAQRLTQAGAQVVLADLDGETATREASRLGPTARAYTVDVTDEDRVRAMVEATLHQFGQIDILVNNAAITGKSSVPHGGPILDISVAQWRHMLDVNLTGAFICAKYAGAEMAKAGGGNIVNIASIQGVYATHQSGDYSTAKAGLIMLTRVLAGELASFGIRVNAVAPGPIDTDVPSDTNGPARTSATLLGRAGTPAEVAEAVLFLVSARGSFVDGELLMVDGGAGIRFRTAPHLEGR
jgi:3-oxoacyl-[acyl-carrier protein] reductase